MPSRRAVLLGGSAALLGGALGYGGLAYRSFLSAARERVGHGSSTFDASFGTFEWGEAGSGPPVLMVHGTGGGFDQGLLFCDRLIGHGFRVVAPSRFGYLGTDYPVEAGSAAQADAFVELLDHLRIERIAVAGGSAGALSAIEFAIRHPDRCTGLVAIVPATYAPERPSYTPMAAWQERAMRAMLGSDLLFWAALKLAPDTMIATMLATDPALVHAASAEEKARVAAILEGIFPVSRRSRGLLNDAVLAGNPAEADLSRIACPTLAVSVEDDRFGTADAARHLARSVPDARLVIYPSGGHVWVGHHAELFAEVATFLDAIARRA